MSIHEDTAECAGDTLYEIDPVKLKKKLKLTFIQVPERIKREKGDKV